MPGRRTKRAGLNGGPSRRRRKSSSSFPDGSSMVFFSIMLPIVKEKKKLKLPMEFGRTYGSTLGRKAHLHLPNGGVWNVGVSKGTRVRDIWLDQGWESFMEENSVLQHYFLTFDYVGKSMFHVRIYDLTTCEIPYPPIHNPTDDGNEMKDGQDEPAADDDDAVDEAQEIHYPSGGSDNAVEEDDCAQISSSDSDEDEDVEEDDDDDDDDDDEDDGGLGDKLVKELKRRRISVSSRFCQRPKLRLEIQRAVKQAMEMKRRNVPSFLVFIQKHNLVPPRLFVPTEFYKEHMMDIESARLELWKGGELKTWDLEFSFLDKGLYFRKGFGEFYADNGLELGDVCLFEMLCEVNVVLRVSICRAGGPN